MAKEALFTPHIYEDWMGNTQREKVLQIMQRVKIPPEAKVLDVGSGPGFLSEFVSGVVEIDTEISDLKRNTGNRILASGDMLPLAASSFDVVFCLDTVHLLSRVDELGRVLKKGGKAVVTRYCNEYNSYDKLSELKNLFSNWKLVDAFIAGTRGKEMDAVIVCNPK